MRPEAVEAMLPYLTDSYGNPSGAHAMARAAARRHRRRPRRDGRRARVAGRARSCSPAAARSPTTPRSSASPSAARWCAPPSSITPCSIRCTASAAESSTSARRRHRSRRLGCNARRISVARVGDARQQRDRHDPAAGGRRRGRSRSCAQRGVAHGRGPGVSVARRRLVGSARRRDLDQCPQVRRPEGGRRARRARRSRPRSAPGRWWTGAGTTERDAERRRHRRDGCRGAAHRGGAEGRRGSDRAPP